MRDKNITKQIHSDAKKRRFAMLFVSGDLRRWQGQSSEQSPFLCVGSVNSSKQSSKPRDRIWGFIQRNSQVPIEMVHSLSWSNGGWRTIQIHQHASGCLQVQRWHIGSCGGAPTSAHCQQGLQLRPKTARRARGYPARPYRRGLGRAKLFVKFQRVSN